MTLLERGQIMRRAAISVFCALIPLCAFDARPAQAEETIMVLDASRSMWGTIDKTTKHTMVHDAFTRAFKQHAAHAPRLGLVTFGNRSPSDCSDISVQIKPGTTDQSEFLSTVRGVRPWGLTPIADALKRAAGEFSDATQPNRIVLVVDGLENCRGNPCATAREPQGAVGRIDHRRRCARCRRQKSCRTCLHCNSDRWNFSRGILPERPQPRQQHPPGADRGRHT